MDILAARATFEVENSNTKKLGLISALVSRNRRIIAFQVPKFTKNKEFSDRESQTMVSARICAR